MLCYQLVWVVWVKVVLLGVELYDIQYGWCVFKQVFWQIEQCCQFGVVGLENMVVVILDDFVWKIVEYCF